jgi:hypothetical protein
MVPRKLTQSRQDAKERRGDELWDYKRRFSFSKEWSWSFSLPAFMPSLEERFWFHLR